MRKTLKRAKEKKDDLPKELGLYKDIKVSDDFDSSLHELKFSCSECKARFSSEFPKSGYPSNLYVLSFSNYLAIRDESGYINFPKVDYCFFTE